MTALKSTVLAALLAITSLSSHALDARFKDANGDLVADAPTDPKEWVDPSTLVFAYTPVEDPAVYAKVWQEFIDHLAKTTGKRVQFFPVQSNAAQLEAMRAGRLHVAGFNTGSNPLAVNCAGFVPFAMMASQKGEFGYEMEIITHPGSGIEKIEDIRGKKLAFTSETSNSGFKAPSALLSSQFKMEAGKDFTPVFSGKHDNSVLGVANKDYPAAAIANSVKVRMSVSETALPAFPTQWRKPPLIQSTWLRRGLWLLAFVYLLLAWASIDVNWTRVWLGLERGWAFVAAFLSPNFSSRWDDIVLGFQESITMTVTSTALGVALSIPVAVGASRNLAPAWVYALCRSFIALSRTLNEIIVAIFLVAMFGFGPFAGFLTLTWGLLVFSAISDGTKS